MRILVIIPARGGSKGIPRKNVRSLAGKPLIAYVIETALASRYNPDVYVSSDDQEILTLAKKQNARIHQRSVLLSDDQTTLDPVIYSAFKEISESSGKTYDLVITLQPTSPLLMTKTFDQAIEKIIDEQGSIDTLISAVDDTHLTWSIKEETFVPNYEKRVNRQYLPKTYKETGGFVISKSAFIRKDSRFGPRVSLFLLPKDQSVDIDHYEDWSLCEYYLKRKTILFCVSGYPSIGLGHVYNTLLLANEITNHKLIFLVDRKSELAYEKIKQYHHEVYLQQCKKLTDDIRQFKPSMVINDRLDTAKEEIEEVQSMGIYVVNFEDLGSGSSSADLVINAMYPEKKKLPNHYFGAAYFCTREEFLLSPSITIKENVKNVLIAFGGVDPNNLTLKAIQAIHDYCKTNGIKITVICGLGYQQMDTLNAFENITVFTNVNNISDYMLMADLAFTSAGRTTFELATLGVPALVMAQNERELTHFFASEENGFRHLGLGSEVSIREISDAFSSLCDDVEQRAKMQQKMLKTDIRSGKKRVVQLIQSALEKL